MGEHAGKLMRSKPKRRWRRRLIVMFIGVVMLACIAAVLVTRSWFLIRVVSPELAKRLGGDVTIAEASYLGGGRFAFLNVDLRSPSGRGDAAEVAHIDRIELGLKLGALLTGKVRVTELAATGARLRFSEDERSPGHFSFMDLNPRWPKSKDKKPPSLPLVELDGVTIEMGSHENGIFTLAGSRRFSGFMHATEGEAGWFNVELMEVDERGNGIGAAGLSIKGRFNPETLEHMARIDGLLLDQRAYAMCPQIARLWWDTMDLAGRIDSTSVRWSPTEGIRTEIDIQDMMLTLPAEVRGQWARFRNGTIESMRDRLRLRVNQGTIEFTGDELNLRNLVGVVGGTDEQDLAGIPYSVNVSVSSLPPLNFDDTESWADDVMRSAAFATTIRLDKLSIGERGQAGSDSAAELPLVVARMLERFEMTGLELSTQLDIRRRAPTPEDPQPPVRAAGQAYLSHATGRFDRFPYRLRNIDAFVEFTNDRVVLHYLTGQGSQGATVRMSGEISPPDRYPKVAIRVTASNVPIDDALNEALAPAQQRTVDMLLDRSAYERLSAAGLLPTNASLAEAKLALEQQQARLRELIVEAAGDLKAPTIMAAQREVDRLKRIVAAGLFELGGRVDLDLWILRGLGQDTRTTVTGDITLQKACLLYTKFPYPVFIHGGKVRWEDDRIVLSESSTEGGLPLTTLGGGAGTARGVISTTRVNDGRRTEPNITIDMVGDPISELVWAAIPVRSKDPAESSDSPDDVAMERVLKIIRGVGLAGPLSYTGVIDTDEEGTYQFDFAVSLKGGSAHPTGELAEAIGAAGLFWPEGFQLEAVSGLVGVRREGLTLHELSGTNALSNIAATGNVDWSGPKPAATISLDFRDLELGQYLVNLVPSQTLERARNLWEKYRPQGRFNAQLVFTTDEHGMRRPELRVMSSEVAVSIGDQPVTLKWLGGNIVIEKNGVSFQELSLEVIRGGQSEGTLVLNGTYGETTNGDDLIVEGHWTNGDLASPLITEALRLFGADEQADRFASFLPIGMFDAEFTFQSAAGERPADYRFSVRPRSIAVVLERSPVSLQIEPGGEAVLRPGEISITGFRGTHIGGQFSLDGTIDVRGPAHAQLTLSYVGRLLNDELKAVLPKTVISSLEAIAFESSESVSISNAALTMRRMPEAGDGRWAVRFDGTVQTTDASIVAGMDLSRINGSFHVVADHVPGNTAMLSIDVQASRAVILGRQVTDVSATVALSPDGKRVHVEDLRGNLCGGIVTLSAQAGLEGSRDYSSKLDLVGVSLKEVATEIVDPEYRALKLSGTGDPPEGSIYGTLSLSGSAGSEASRRGRGLVRVMNGRLASMPLVFRLLQVLQLAPPMQGSSDFADADFYIVGDRVTFERLLLESTVLDRTPLQTATVQLQGTGDMRIGTWDLGLVFRIRGMVPLLSAVVGTVSDQLYLIEITGTLADPRPRLAPLPGLSMGQPGAQARERTASVTD